MTADKSMTNSAEIVAKAMIDEHSDFLKESARLIAQELMEAEIANQIGAKRGEISGDRSTHRNGYRQRPWDTRVGEIELAVPRKRSGESYFPSFLEPRKRSEKALLGVVMEAFRKRSLDQEGRPAGLRARNPHEQGPGLKDLRRA
jgi:transposase-like protein